MNKLNEKSINSFAWKSAQSICSLGITFIIQLVLARILLPEDFGIIAISTVFMTIANTIIETSFSSAVIQKNNLSQNLLSSIFYANLVLSVIIYLLLFFSARFIANFYGQTILIKILRIQGCRVVISGLYSIPQALMNRDMRFKELFFCNLWGTIVQAVVGFYMAYNGNGIWALVIPACINSAVTGILILVKEPWMPKKFFSLSLVKNAIEFSSKILIIRVVRKIFYNIRVLAIGKVYDATIVGYFNKGFQFPSTVMTVVDGSLTSVAFTHLSKLQNEMQNFIYTLRQYVRVSMFICVPLMSGMILVAEPMVLLLLTDKWIKCVPYLQLICMSQLFTPLNIKTIAFEALGKSDISMRLNLNGIIVSTFLLIITIPFSPLIMTASGVLSNIILQILIAVSTMKSLEYSIRDQIVDMLYGAIPTLFMIIVVGLLGSIAYKEHYFIELLVKIVLGVVSFIGCSVVTKNEIFFLIIESVRIKLRREKNE